MTDARQGQDIRVYVAMVMKHAKAADMDKPLLQLSHMYNNLDPEFRPQITALNKKTVVSEWLQTMADIM